MMNEYQRLDPRIQKWIYRQGWADLRELQKKAVPPILAGDRDVLISAATAAGKTEAFSCPPVLPLRIFRAVLAFYILAHLRP